VWWHDRRKDAYVPLTAARRSRLLRVGRSVGRKPHSLKIAE